MFIYVYIHPTHTTKQNKKTKSQIFPHLFPQDFLQGYLQVLFLCWFSIFYFCFFLFGLWLLAIDIHRDTKKRNTKKNGTLKDLTSTQASFDKTTPGPTPCPTRDYFHPECDKVSV